MFIKINYTLNTKKNIRYKETTKNQQIITLLLISMFNNRNDHTQQRRVHSRVYYSRWPPNKPTDLGRESICGLLVFTHCRHLLLWLRPEADTHFLLSH